MGRSPTRSLVDDVVRRFADRLRREVAAERVLLLGSRARGTGRFDSDYDLIVVSAAFETVEPWARGHGLRRMFREEGGFGGVDVICLAPEEFERAKQRVSLIAAVLPEAVDPLTPTPSAG